jgi:hypothetical protein
MLNIGAYASIVNAALKRLPVIRMRMKKPREAKPAGHKSFLKGRRRHRYKKTPGGLIHARIRRDLNSLLTA